MVRNVVALAPGRAGQPFHEYSKGKRKFDKGKRKFDDMSATEQQTVEDFDCGKLTKRHDELRIQKPDRFGKMNWDWTANLPL